MPSDVTDQTQLFYLKNVIGRLAQLMDAQTGLVKDEQLPGSRW